MDLEFHKVLAESKILHTFNLFLMFEFTERTKRQIAEGTFEYKYRKLLDTLM